MFDSSLDILGTRKLHYAIIGAPSIEVSGAEIDLHQQQMNCRIGFGRREIVRTLPLLGEDVEEVGDEEAELTIDSDKEKYEYQDQDEDDEEDPEGYVGSTAVVLGKPGGSASDNEYVVCVWKVEIQAASEIERSYEPTKTLDEENVLNVSVGLASMTVDDFAEAVPE